MRYATLPAHGTPVAAARTSASAVEWWLGFLLGVPIAVPAPPYYWIGFLCFAVLLFRGRERPLEGSGLRALAVWALIAIALTSSLFGLVRYELDAARILTTSFFFLLFFAAGRIDDKRAFFAGFCRAMLMWSILVIAMAIYLRIDENGLLLFSVPEFRLWGADYFPDWPNYFAFLLSLAFLLNALLFKQTVPAILQLVAALLTTSRTPLIALGAFLTVLALRQVRKRPLRAMFVLVLFLLFVVVALPVLDLASTYSDFTDRLLVFEDREDIYSFGLDLVRESPGLGHGAILLDESIGFNGYPSFHNSYLDVAVRHGVVGLAIFIGLLVPPLRHVRRGGLAFVCIVSFVLIGSLFQNFLKQPHILMLYVVLAETGFAFDRDS